MGQFKILNHQIDSTSPMFIIAEVAQAHDGSLGLAHAFIDAAAKANANAIKFQTHIADAESTPQEPWRVKFSPQDETRYEYWQRMEFTPEQWAGLHQHAADTGLVFLSSAFSAAAVDLLERLDISAWKVASGEINNHPLLDHMMTTQKPILLSSGMSSFAELDRAVNRCKQAGVAVGVFQCTSMYPTPPEKIGLNVIEEMRSRYGIPVGLSDHSARGAAGVAAAVVGADMLEVHVTFHEDMFGPDVPASLTFENFSRMVSDIRFIEAMLRSPVDKNEMAHQLAPLRDLFTKSIVAADDLPAGHPLTRDDLDFKKPGTGIPAASVRQVIGRVLRQPVKKNHILEESDFSPHGPETL